MKNIKKYITWQPVLTDHQAFTYEALAQVSGCPVLAYVSSMEDKVRKKQGWADTTVNSIERILLPKVGFLYYCYCRLKEERDCVHIFASPFQQPRIIVCMFIAVLLRNQFYLISEPYSPNTHGYLSESNRLLGRIKKILRPYLYRVYALIFRSHLSGIFAISPLALAQYERAGVPRNKLFDFGYFVPRVNFSNSPQKKPILNSKPQNVNKGLRLIFVGALIKRKGIDLLVDAVNILYQQGSPICLDIYGYSDKSIYEINNPAITYKGPIPFGGSQRVISEYDLLVLPSRYDGWGVVVNEALCAGVPVITSDATGAGVVACYLGAGLTFESENLEALRDGLLMLIKTPKLLKSLQASTDSARDALQPLNAGYYLNAIINSNNSSTNSIKSIWLGS